jgi:hypothetical protein
MDDELFVAMWCSKIDCMQCMCWHSTCVLVNTIERWVLKHSQNQGQVLLLIR